MRNITTPQAILCGLGLIALAITLAPHSSSFVKPAYAISNNVVVDDIVSEVKKLRQAILTDHNQLYALIKETCKR